MRVFPAPFVVVITVGLPVCGDRGKISADTPLPLAQRVCQLDLIEKTDGQKLDDVDRTSPLTGILGVLREPPNEARPTRQLGEQPRLIFLPSLGWNLQSIQAEDDRFFG